MFARLTPFCREKSEGQLGPSPTLLLIERKPGSWARQASRIPRLLPHWYQLLLVESSVRSVVSVACVNAVYQASNLTGWHKAYFECVEIRLLLGV